MSGKDYNYFRSADLGSRYEALKDMPITQDVSSPGQGILTRPDPKGLRYLYKLILLKLGMHPFQREVMKIRNRPNA